MDTDELYGLKLEEIKRQRIDAQFRVLQTEHTVDRVGRSGGLAVLWKQAALCQVDSFSSHHGDMIFMDTNNISWRLSCYYGYPERTRRHKKGKIAHPQYLLDGFSSVIEECQLTEEKAFWKQRAKIYLLRDRDDNTSKVIVPTITFSKPPVLDGIDLINIVAAELRLNEQMKQIDEKIEKDGVQRIKLAKTGSKLQEKKEVKILAEAQRARAQHQRASAPTLIKRERGCLHTRSRTRKRTLDKAKEEVVVVQKEVFEEKKKVEEEEKVEEPVLVEMGDQAENPKALMDYSQPKINDIQSSIIRPAIRVNTFEIKSSTIQMIQNSVQFGGSPTEDPNMHIRDFIEICDTFKFNDVTEDAINL
ncbi:hypothetical protein AgCh_026115 [Apium graveolens]